MESIRETNVPGTHIVTYKSDIDSIELKHVAHNRKGFALELLWQLNGLLTKKVYSLCQMLLKIPT